MKDSGNTMRFAEDFLAWLIRERAFEVVSEALRKMGETWQAAARRIDDIVMQLGDGWEEWMWDG